MPQDPHAPQKAACVNAEHGTSKRRATRYKREPPILTRDAVTSKLQRAGLKREAPWVTGETVGLAREGGRLNREARLLKREARLLKREGTASEA